MITNTTPFISVDRSARPRQRTGKVQVRALMNVVYRFHVTYERICFLTRPAQSFNLDLARMVRARDLIEYDELAGTTSRNATERTGTSVTVRGTDSTSRLGLIERSIKKNTYDPGAIVMFLSSWLDRERVQLAGYANISLW